MKIAKAVDLLQTVIVAVLVAVAAKSSAQPQPLTDLPYKVQISCGKDQLLIAEPLVLQVVITNTTSTNILVATEMRNGAGWAGYMVSSNGTNFVYIQPPSVRDPVGGKETVAPNQAYYHEEVLAYAANTDGFVFPVPGEYYVLVDYLGRKSNVIKLRVTDAQTTSDRKWADALKEREVIINLVIPTWRSGRTIKILTECAREESVYAPYAAYALASAETNNTNALALFEKADVVGFPLQSRAILGKALVNEALGNLQTARQQFERILIEFPATAAAAEARKRLARMAPIP